LHSNKFRQALDAFNNQNFFQAHELWEEIWQDLRITKQNLQQQTQIQVLIQIAVSLHLLKEKRLKGAKKVLVRARNNLKNINYEIENIDLQNLLTQIESFFAKSDQADIEKALNVKINI